MPFVPLYLRIKELIRADLLGGGSDGTRLPSERELQVRYRASRPTISKALTALAAEGLLVKSQGRGSFLASGARPGSAPLRPIPRRIGYVAPLAGEALVQRTLRGIERAAQRHGYSLLMGNAGNDVAREEAAVRDLIASGAQGLVIYPVSRREDAARTDYLRPGAFVVPMVLIDTCTPEQGHTQVVFDNRRLCHEVTRALLGRGHRRIALLTYEAGLRHTPLAERLHGYRDALHEHGLAHDETLVARFAPSQERHALAPILERWLTSSQPPTAIIATEDMVALEVIELLLSRGVRVPEQVRVVGFDNREAARRYQPAFDTTNPNFDRMGDMAAELLLEMLETGPQPARTYVLDVPVLMRHGHEGSDLLSGPAPSGVAPRQPVGL